MQDTGIIENVYEELCSYENLETAFNRARRGKTLKDYVIEFEAKLKENLLQLRTELLLQTYQPQPLNHQPGIEFLKIIIALAHAEVKDRLLGDVGD